jgi:hypothetical protein
MNENLIKIQIFLAKLREIITDYEDERFDIDPTMKRINEIFALYQPASNLLLLSQQIAEKDQQMKGFAGAVLSINRDRHHIIMIAGDDHPCYWQRKEWVDWIVDMAQQLIDQ